MTAAPSPMMPESQAPGMSRVVAVQDQFGAWLIPGRKSPPSKEGGYSDRADAAIERGVRLCAELEAGNILFCDREAVNLYFPRTAFPISAEEREFLLGQKQTSAAYHKNIAYRPGEDRVTGLDKSEAAEAERLRKILRDYSQRATEFLEKLLPPYAGKWKLDFASYRPLEEKGRPARTRARNDLPHVDSFPTRPTNGDRILRLFTNINPSKNRVWITSEMFEAIAPRFAEALGIPGAPSGHPAAKWLRALAHRSSRLLPGLAPFIRRSPYDVFMHRCHNAMKEDAAFQAECPKQRWEFPPDATWIVFTDCVSHAVLEGQYALEQTFLVSREALVAPERSPLAVLERLAGHSLTIPAV